MFSKVHDFASKCNFIGGVFVNYPFILNKCFIQAFRAITYNLDPEPISGHKVGPQSECYTGPVQGTIHTFTSR